MLVRQPEYHVSIGRRHHIVPRIPFAHGGFPRMRQHRHGPELFPLAFFRHHPLRVPHHRIVVRARASDQVPPIGTEACVALAEGPRRARRGPCEGLMRTGAEGLETAFEGVEDDMPLRRGCGEQERFAVVGEFELCPRRRGGRGIDAPEVEGGEGGFVVVT